MSPSPPGHGRANVVLPSRLRVPLHLVLLFPPVMALSFSSLLCCTILLVRAREHDLSLGDLYLSSWKPYLNNIYVTIGLGLGLLLATIMSFLYAYFVSLTALNWPPVTKTIGDRHRPYALMVVLGAGGHTAELMPLVRALTEPGPGSTKPKYVDRTYVHAFTDVLAPKRALAFEQERNSHPDEFRIVAIPRAREVGQSYFSSVASTLKAIWWCFSLLSKHPPDLLLCNGPGTCVPVVMAAALVRIGLIGWRMPSRAARIVYVESAARVNALSLTGNVLHVTRLADRIYVQWESLADPENDIFYVGRLV